MTIITKNDNKVKTYHYSFDGGNLTSHGGLFLIDEFLQTIKFKKLLKKFFKPIKSKIRARYDDYFLLTQHILQIISGYKQSSSSFHLGQDALFLEIMKTSQLASAATFSRFFNSFTQEQVNQLRELNRYLVKQFLKSDSPNYLIIDIDTTNVEAFGSQEGNAYNHHYRTVGLSPLLAFDGVTGYCFDLELRSGSTYCSTAIDTFIEPILKMDYPMIVRADSGFATPVLYDLIESYQKSYAIRLKANAVLKRQANGNQTLPVLYSDQLMKEVNHYHDMVYQAGSWGKSRRVAVHSHHAINSLVFDHTSIVTNLDWLGAEDVFNFYRQRGAMENLNKEVKNGYFISKVDHHSMVVNEAKQLLGVIAYNIMRHLRNGIKKGSETETMEIKVKTIDTFRKNFINIPAKIIKSGRRLEIKLNRLSKQEVSFHTLVNWIRNQLPLLTINQKQTIQTE